MAFALTLFLRLLSSAYCLMIVQDTVNINVPANLPGGVRFHNIIAVDNTTGLRIQEPRFHILKTTVFGPEDAVTAPNTFALQHEEENVHILSISNGLPLDDYANYTFAMEIEGSAPGDPIMQNMTVVVNVVDWGDRPCSLREELCFPYSKLHYEVPESLRKGSVIASMKPTVIRRLCPHIQRFYSLPSKGPLAVEGETGEISVSDELDFESIQRYSVHLSCHLVNVKDETESAFFNAGITLLVKDVDDNAPYLQQSTSSLLEIDTTFISAGKALPQFMSVLDKDTREVNNISVSLMDPQDLFSVKEIITFDNAVGNEMLISAVVVASEQFSFPEETYNFSAVFVDEGLVTKEENKVVFHVVIINKTHSASFQYTPPPGFQLKANISRNAQTYSKVVQPFHVAINQGYQFHLESRRRLFSVTNRTGIIYVKNHTLLRSFLSDSVRLNLTLHSKGQIENHCIVIVRIFNSEMVGGKCDNASGCAIHGNEESCKRSCGKGSPDGLCQWRRQPDPDRLTQDYATCSPDFETCPDGICDELEANDVSLCPQDCSEHIVGEAVPFLTGKGIHLAAGNCSCDAIGSCSCIRDHAPGNRTKFETLNRERGKDQPFLGVKKVTLQPQPNTISLPSDANSIDDLDRIAGCGPICLITVGVVFLTTVILAASLAVFRYVRKSQDQHKYVGNRVPLTAVVSDYVDHTIATSSGSEMQPDSALDKSTGNSKWEFPRDRLVFKETLGEGEFGKVIKAQAWEIGNRPGYSTVAIKMIKECGTDAEEQDLISEFNLLKEVSHPNIIQLLGACTSKGGPLYVIVEYAECGSLRNYLRKVRRSQETPRCRTVCNPAYFEEGYLGEQEMRSNPLRRELFSFAWQISKGMAYLADMKVVHRDLAARNILLMENKIIKISDFGLSRDVYEGDTYLKTTKSRVPVKWMAIESLGDQIYTTKSDVWSFGIIMWELITLGASPYPGIMSEGLYHLLKEGYRMPQPENCPKEFYHIMFACWRTIPRERPSFKELVQKLERMLQDTVDYLPLTSEETRTVKNECCSAEASSSSPMLPTSDKNSRRAEGFLSNGQGSVKRSKISKPCLYFTKSPDTNYESRRLLQTPSEESTSA